MGIVYGAMVCSKRNEEGHKNTWRETFGGSSKAALAPTSESSPTPGDEQNGKLAKGKTTLVDKQKAKLAKEKQQQKDDKGLRRKQIKKRKKRTLSPHSHCESITPANAGQFRNHQPEF